MQKYNKTLNNTLMDSINKRSILAYTVFFENYTFEQKECLKTPLKRF
jgi:hypothetical protein